MSTDQKLYNALRHGILDLEEVEIKRKPLKIAKSYEYQKSMLYAIQALTNEPTHEILANLVTEADKHIAASDIDLTKTPRENKRSGTYNYGQERRSSKQMFYPGTKLHVGLYMLYSETSWNYRSKVKEKYMLKYNFKFPSTALKLDQNEYDEYIADGILCEASKDVEEPEMKSTLTKDEMEINKAQSRRKAAQKAADKRAAQAAKSSHITTGHRLKKKKKKIRRRP